MRSAGESSRKASVVLSLFPGFGVLDSAFEAEGFTIVRGPDLLWGGDVKRFHPPAGIFWGVIGGPPCQAFSRLRHLYTRGGGRVPDNLIPEYERIVGEARPAWFVMENVEGAPLPAIDGYQVQDTLLDARWLGEIQQRLHRFSFGTADGRRLNYRYSVFESIDWQPRVTREPVRVKDRPYVKRSLADECELQGLPRDIFEHTPFTKRAARQMLANAVPYPMGRELARAVMEATADPRLDRAGQA